MRIEIHHVISFASADNDCIAQLLAKILERVKKMPTVDEMKQAVADAVAAEREQVREAITKAVQDALAAAPETISQATIDAVVASIKSVYEPDAPTA